MPELIADGEPLSGHAAALSPEPTGGKTVYARDDADRDELLTTEFRGKKAEIGRFKGLGEMP